jgi:predicted phage tail protein
MTYIYGAGGGGGNSGKRQKQKEAPRPKIAQDDPELRSISFAQMQFMLCEGEVEGPAFGNTQQGLERSVFLDDTPVRDAAGNVSPQPEDLVFSWGRPHSEQSGVPSFSRVSNTIGVDTLVEFGTPVSQNVTADVVGAQYYARVILTWQSLYVQVVNGKKTKGNDGDIRAWAVSYRIQATDSLGTVRTYFDGELKGKFSSSFQKAHEFPLEGVGPDWTITVTRLSEDDDAANPNVEVRHSVFNFSTVVMSLDQKFSYAHTSMLSVGIRADQYSSIPNVSVEMKGMRIQIPSNYDPVARTYTGTWDGLFKIGYTDNPAWVLRDMILNDRYGCGQYISDAAVDKWSLYEIAQYCDGLVDAPGGGSEPRFTCNLLLQSGEEAWGVLQQISSIFRGMMYYAGSMAIAVQDRDKDAIYTFNESNTIEQFDESGRVSQGNFIYSGTARRARHTVVLTSWDDPANDYETRIEYVSDDESYSRHGYRPLDLRLLGVTSRGQALRAANWALLSERLLDDTVSFSTNEIGSAVRPGDIIKIADPTKAALRAGGRIKEVAGTTITLDEEPKNPPGGWGGATFSWMAPDADGEPQLLNANITSQTGAVITIDSTHGNPPVATFPWLIEFANRSAQPFRVLTVAEEEGGVFNLTALRYREDIFNAVDFDTPLQDDENYLFKVLAPNVPANVQAQVIWDNNQAKIEIRWDPPTNSAILNEYDLTVREYRVQWQAGTKNDDNSITWSGAWRELPRQLDNIELVPIELLTVTDKYRVRISAVGRLGQESPWSPLVIADDIWVWFPMPDLSGPYVAPLVNPLSFYNQSTGGQLFTWDFGGLQIPPYVSGIRLECKPERPLTPREAFGIRDAGPDGYYIYGDYDLEKYGVCIFHADTNWRIRISFNTFVVGLRGDSYAQEVVDRKDLVPPWPNEFTVVTDTDKRSIAPSRRFSWALPTTEINEYDNQGDPLVTDNWPLGKVTDINRFQVRYKAGFKNIWDLGVPLFADGVPGDQRYFETNLFDGGTWTVMIRCVDATGWVSDSQANIIVGFGDAIPTNVVETFYAEPNFLGQKNNMQVVGGGVDWGNSRAICEPYTGSYLESDVVNESAVSICTDAPTYNSPPFQAGVIPYDNADIQPRNKINQEPTSLVQIDPTKDGQYFFAIDVTTDNAGILIHTLSDGTYQWFIRQIGQDLDSRMYPDPQPDPMYPDPQSAYMYFDTIGAITKDFHPYVPFEKLDSGQYELAVLVKSIDAVRPTAITSVEVEMDYPDVVKTFEDVPLAAGTQRVWFDEPFPVKCKAVNITFQDPPGGAATPVTALLMGKDPRYFEVRALDKDGNITAALIDAVAVGY